MTRGREFKRKVRARMRLTGERYTTALSVVRDASEAVRPEPQAPERQAMTAVADLFSRFTDRARVAVVKSENLARRDGSPTVEARHMLLGAIAAAGVGLEVLRSHGDVQSLIDAALIDDADFAELPHVPYSPESKKVIEHCLVVSLAAGDNEIHTTHVLAALLDNQDDDVRRMLAACSVDLDLLRVELPAPDATDRARVRDELSSQGTVRLVQRPVAVERPEAR